MTLIRIPFLRRKSEGISFWLVWLAPSLLSLAPVGAFAAQPEPGQEIVRDGSSPYVIYVEKSAPGSVHEAAAEVCRVIALSTGVELPISHEPSAQMIALGDSPAAREAGLDAAQLPLEGFRILSAGTRIFIVGSDTKDGEFTAGGGLSDGTYYGAMEFLERFIGVRWLMPAEGGEDVPLHKEWDVPFVDFSDAPAFASRVGSRFWVGQNKDGNPTTNAPWNRRMRIADRLETTRQPLLPDYNHAWESYGMPERLRGRPELLAIVNGQHQKIEQADTELSNIKYATTNPGLIDIFTSALLEEIEKSPGRRMWSIGPSDGDGWCESREAVALDERTSPSVWPGNAMFDNKSLSPRVLKFYNEVAQRVKAKHPDKTLGSFVYAAYTYPPGNGMEIESNLFFMLGVRSYYGFTLFRPDLQEELPRLIEAWAKLMPGRMGWFDYSSWVSTNRINVGAPYPPGIPILKLIFPAIHKSGYVAAFWDTNVIQGYGALYSYLAAKLMWNPNADVDALANDWLERAYGPGWQSMRKLYDLLDQKVAEYRNTVKDDWNYRCTPEQVKAIHLPIFPQMEALYLEAMAKCETDAQRKRLAMFGDNLILLHWNLRKAGWLQDPERSSFYRSDKDFRRFVIMNADQPSISRTYQETARDKFFTPQLTGTKAAPISPHN